MTTVVPFNAPPNIFFVRFFLTNKTKGFFFFFVVIVCVFALYSLSFHLMLQSETPSESTFDSQSAYDHEGVPTTTTTTSSHVAEKELSLKRRRAIESQQLGVCFLWSCPVQPLVERGRTPRGGRGNRGNRGRTTRLHRIANRRYSSAHG